MSSRRINSRLEPQLSAGVPRFPPWPAALNCLAHAAPSGLLNGIFTVQPYTDSRADSRAGSTEAWCFQFARTWCYLAINLQTHGDRILPWSYTCVRESTSTLLQSETPASPYQPHYPEPLDVTEMVEKAAGVCQLNTARRILAECQLRINGFNTYG
ncbi:hypothetical protein IQ07DRAFT_645574 [Pyrenochaeta sp. DS3sAY3a]|nr:hypothetical protein IQ07DRAFT_645574 [Pyrenochaeta sp. DS3sAY3a]